jgi:hypothetical protein
MAMAGLGEHGSWNEDRQVGSISCKKKKGGREDLSGRLAIFELWWLVHPSCAHPNLFARQFGHTVPQRENEMEERRGEERRGRVTRRFCAILTT